MSAESREWLSNNTLIGYTEKRGNAWHYREGDDNHFEGPVPRERVEQLLDFPLIEARAGAILDDGSIVESSKHKSIVRGDTGEVFHFPSPQFRIHQPIEWTVRAVDAILDDGANIGSAISLRGGALVAVQAELDETRQSAEGVEFRPFLNAATANDGTMSTRYFRGCQAVVCDNTFAIALREANEQVRVSHRAGSLSQIGSVRHALRLEIERTADAFDAEVRQLTAQYVSDDMWRAFTNAYTGIEKVKDGRAKTNAERKVGQLQRLWVYDPRVAPWRNSAFGVLAAVNTATHHLFGSNEGRAERNLLRAATGKWENVDRDTLAMLAAVG